MTMKLQRRVAIGAGAALALAAGGTGVAVAVSNGDDGAGKPVPAAAAAQAKAAALKVTGGGTVTALELDGEHGATYEVEVTTPAGGSVDVRLDDRFVLVGQPEPNGDAGD
jgi:NAD(P)-dependent dehydrogenase (short-subunit alcohol dehydrogenase family)